MISLSTRFFGQPRLIIPTREGRAGSDIGAKSNRWQGEADSCGGREANQGREGLQGRQGPSRILLQSLRSLLVPEVPCSPLLAAQLRWSSPPQPPSGNQPVPAHQ